MPALADFFLRGIDLQSNNLVTLNTVMVARPRTCRPQRAQAPQPQASPSPGGAFLSCRRF